MTFSTFDIITSASDIKKLHDLLVEAVKHDADGKIVITNEEAQEIGTLIVELAKKLSKTT